MSRTPKFYPAKKLVLSALLLLTLFTAAQASASPKRVALFINARDPNQFRFDKIGKSLKDDFDKIIFMNNFRKGDLIPTRKNLRTTLKTIGKSEPGFLLVYYFGYGKVNRIALNEKYLSRNMLWSWIEDASASSLTIIDALPPSLTFSDKKQSITPLKEVPASPPHYYLLNRQRGFLGIFEKIITALDKSDLNIMKFYDSVTDHYRTQIDGDISLLEIIPAPGMESPVIAHKNTVPRPVAKMKPVKKTPKKISKPEKKPAVKKTATPIKAAVKAKKLTSKKPVAKPKPQPKPVAKKTVKTPLIKPIKPGYFKPLNFKPEISVFDIQTSPLGTPSPVDGNKIVPILYGAILYGLNVDDGSSVWKIPIDRRLSEYGINFVDERYVFALLQNEFDGSGMLKVIKRANGVELQSHQIWGDLTYYQQYQQPFVTARINGNYLVFLVLRKPDRTSEIRKIIYNSENNKLTEESYDLDYQLTSPIGYQENLQSIFWGGKKRQNNQTILGQLNLATGQKKDYILTAQSTDYTDYIIEDPPVVLPSGYINLPHTLYFFVSLNKKILSKKSENLIAIYQLSRPGKLIPTSDFNNHKLVARLVKEKIIRTETADHSYFDLTIHDENKLKQRLKGFDEIEQILDIWRKYPPSNLELPEHNLYKFKGHTISSPALFKDPQETKLNYLYFFSAITPVDTDEAGIEKVLTLFEAYFWQKGVYLGANNFSLPDLAASNLLGAPLVVKQDSDYLMLMASDEVYVYTYVRDPSGQKVWTQNHRYNAAIRERSDQAELFYGISSTPIRRVQNIYLIRSVFHGRTKLYGFRLVKNEKTGYGLDLAWVFKGGDPISAPLAHVKNTDEISVVSGGKFLSINMAVLGKSGQDKTFRAASMPGHSAAYKNIFAKPTIHKNDLYWVSLGTMFTKEMTEGANPEKFVDISSKISTGISFSDDKFCYGTESNGVEVYNFNKDNYYSFFNLDGRVTSTPLMNEDMVYFATESEAGNYFYGMKLDNRNFFLLPRPGWETMSKAFTSPDSWRFNIKDAQIISKPVLGLIANKEVVFAATTTGVIYAFDQKPNKNSNMKRPQKICKLPRIDEGITSPMLFDPTNKVLYCMSNKGKLYLLDPDHITEAIVFAIPETDDYRDFRPTAMALSGDNLCFSVTSKKLTSVFYCLNYMSGRYLRVPLPKEAVYEPLVVGNIAYVSCRSGEIYRIELPASLLLMSREQKANNIKKEATNNDKLPAQNAKTAPDEKPETKSEREKTQTEKSAQIKSAQKVLYRGWYYLGRFDANNKKWTEKTIHGYDEEIPQVGQKVTMATSVNLRDDRPHYPGRAMGKKIKVVPTGLEITIEEVDSKVGFGHVWAKTQFSKEDLDKLTKQAE